MVDKTLERLVNYAYSLNYCDLSAKVVHQVKRLMIDSLGCGIGAFNSPPVKILRQSASFYKSNNPSTLLGTNKTTAPDIAALANGAMIRYLDFNDNYAGKSNAHPSDSVAPMMAVAEAFNVSGQDLITGIVLAYEIQSTWADTFRLKDGGPWDQAVYPTISMPLGAGKVIDLNKQQLAEALRISVVQGLPLLQARRGKISHWKACAVPNAGRNGIVSAILAKNGLTGPAEIFEGVAGFFAGVSRGPLHLESLAGESENEHLFRIMKSSIKRFPAGFFSQTAIEGALSVRETLGIVSSEDIERVLVKTFDHGFSVMAGDPTRWRPKTRETADHSIPFVVACALHFGSVYIEHFEESVLFNPKILSLMDKIEVQLDPECEAAWPDATLNIVTVEMKDGRTHTIETPHYLGHFKRPMSDGDIENKFRRLTKDLLHPNQQEETFNIIWNLENVKDISKIFENMVITKKASHSSSR
jgi:2-methylcitrate dehydratase